MMRILVAPIPGYEGYYEATSDGRIFSVDREISHSRLGTMRRKRTEMLQHMDSRGYMRVTLYRDNTCKSFGAHRLIASAFLGMHEGLTVDHLDNDRSNNNIDNLEWVTDRENIQRAVRRRGYLGRLRGRSKLTEELADEIRRNLAEGMSHRAIAKLYGVCKSTVTWINLGKTWANPLKYNPIPAKLEEIKGDFE